MNPNDFMSSGAMAESRHKKWLWGLLVLAVVLFSAVLVFTKKTSVGNNLGAQVYPLPGSGSSIGTGSVGCASLAPWVQVNTPAANQVYVSGQKINVTWSSCGIPGTASGTLVLTRVSGSGPMTMGPYTITGSQSSYATPAIAMLPGVYNGSNATTGTYKATVTYGSIIGNSNNFLIMQAPLGLELQYGPNYYFGTVGNGQSQVYFEQWVAVKALGQDIYLDKDTILNSSLTNAQTTTLKEFYVGANNSVGAAAPLDAVILAAPVLAPVTAGMTLQPGGTYKIPVGTIAQFKITTMIGRPTTAVAPYQRWVTFAWTGFGFAVSDMTANLYQAAYNPLERTGILQKF